MKEDYQVLHSPEVIYKHMLADVRNAKKEILLETYIYGNDKIGREFKDELTKKALSGVKIKVLVDAWGSNVNKKFFKKLIDAGGKVRFFRKLRYAWRFIEENHKRNHRKLLIIDREISYVGSINITASCLKWEELVIRINSPLAVHLRTSFDRVWKRFNIWKIKRMKRIVHEGFEILHDFPTGKLGFTGKRYIKLISKAQKEILIITPYFLPSVRIRRALKKAIKRGVNVKVILPETSDVKILDIFRGRYTRLLLKKGIKIYYSPKILHSKLLIIDNKFFLVGSSNLDYRSFMHQFELNIVGTKEGIIKDLRDYFYRSLKSSRSLDYETYGTDFLAKVVDRIIHPLREYF